MEWNKTHIQTQPFCTYKVFHNSKGMKPFHIEIPAENTQIHIKKNSDTVLLCIGESWTYGESLPGVSTSIGEFSVTSQVENCFGPRLSVLLDCDYFQYAVPGNCNFYMIKELNRIIAELDKQYDNIYICHQFTEPSREHILVNELISDNHPLALLYDRIYLRRNKIQWSWWLTEYDRIMYSEIDKALKPYKTKIKKAVVWKNFCKISDETDYNFIKPEDTWIQFSAKWEGKNIKAPCFYVAGWLDHMIEFYPEIIYDPKFTTKHLKIIEASNKFLNNCTTHIPHPSVQAHGLWAQHLYERYFNAK